VVYPQGLPFSALGPGYTAWAATGPLDSLANGVDDLLFVSNLLDALQRLYCVDPQRIYATGFSAGGAMTSFLTCGLTGRIAAFAPMSGDAYQFREDPDWRRIGVMEWLTTWAARDRCARGPNTFIQEALVLAQQWTGCRDGTAIVHCRITGLGHAGPPPIDGRSAVDIIWSFFQTHPLPAT
jgi:polyhydroxybutyrate depolymerase